jgi:hypothetical protein
MIVAEICPERKNYNVNGVSTNLYYTVKCWFEGQGQGQGHTCPKIMFSYLFE